MLAIVPSVRGTPLLLLDHRVQDILGEPRLGAVAVRQPVHDGDGLGLAAAREEELGALKEVKHEEADAEHDERDDADRQDKVPPPNVGRPPPDEEPGQQRRGELADGPPDGQERQQRGRGVGEELEEQGAVDGQVAADAEAEQREEEADGGPGRAEGGEDAEEGGDEQGDVEGDAAAEDVGADAPGEAAEAEAEEEVRGGVADLFFGHVEFGGEGGED